MSDTGSPSNSPSRHSPRASSPAQSPGAGCSPVKSPVTGSLPPLPNGSSLTLNIAKRRHVDDVLSPSEHKNKQRSSSGVATSPQHSLVTPSKQNRSVSTPSRLLTPRGLNMGRRTPSLADRPIPVLMPKDDETDERSRSRRSSYAQLYDTTFEKDPNSLEEGKEVKKEQENEKQEEKAETAEEKGEIAGTADVTDDVFSNGNGKGSGIVAPSKTVAELPSGLTAVAAVVAEEETNTALNTRLSPPPDVSDEPPASPRKAR